MKYRMKIETRHHPLQQDPTRETLQYSGRRTTLLMQNTHITQDILHFKIPLSPGTQGPNSTVTRPLEGPWALLQAQPHILRGYHRNGVNRPHPPRPGSGESPHALVKAERHMWTFCWEKPWSHHRPVDEAHRPREKPGCRPVRI